MKNILIILIIIPLTFAAIWGFLVEPNMLAVDKVNISISGLPKEYQGMKILLIGDVHAGSPFIDKRKLDKIVQLSNEEKPDLALFAGDYVVQFVLCGKFINPSSIAKQLSRINAPRGRICVLGNHDWWYNGYKIRTIFEKNGFKVLENESINVANKKEPPLWIAGLADLEKRKPDLRNAIKNINPKDPIILLMHEPDFFAEVPNMPKQVKLVLAGHTHGGQVRLPFVGGLIVPSAYGNRYSKGYIKENGKQMFVTSGVGTSILPVRFLCPPEIVIITLHNR